MPSMRLMTDAVKPCEKQSEAISSIIKVTMIHIGKSRLIIVPETLSGLITEHKPITIRILNMFEPITLLTDMSLAFFSEEVILTAASGALVPKATIVSPIMMEGI